MKRFALALVLLWPVTGLGAGNFYTGNDVQELCLGTAQGEANANVTKYNECVGYLGGVVDATKALDSWDYRNKYGAPFGNCVPEDTGQGQLRAAWLKYASEYPEKLHLAAGGLSLIAFEAAWPCERFLYTRL